MKTQPLNRRKIRASASSPYPSLSVIIPVYNEERTIAEIIQRVLAVPIRKEIIVVDDASTDATPKILKSLKAKELKVVRLPHNCGKGAALRAGFQLAKNEVVLIQDADLEYDPADYAELLAPFAQGEADVVFGSRFLTTKCRRVLYYWHSVMNHTLTLMSNVITNLNLTDMETCYKLIRREVLQRIKLRENRFGIEPELTIKLARTKARFYEVGISYHGRSYREGKKIRAKDAVRALYCLLRYAVWD